jgi:glycosyltransferase involved in cell wall biosynthesis
VQATGVDVERFASVNSAEEKRLRLRLGIGDERVLLSVSRLSEEKNVDFLIDALALLVYRCTIPCKLVIVGEGKERDRLRAKLESHSLQDRVLLVGDVPQSELPAFYALADLFVFASRSETQGMVILEAMAAGLPVVAVRSSGINDFVRNGFNGFTTPLVGEQWAERVELLLADNALRKEFAANASDSAQSHNLVAFGCAVARVYAHVLTVRRRRERKSVMDEAPTGPDVQPAQVDKARDVEL